MKRIFTLVAALLMTVGLWAQSPEKMSYQAVVRNSSDVLITSTVVGMQLSILQGSINGTPVYVETQSPTTNTNGLVSLEIGAGTIVSGDFATIDWSAGPYFIKTETDINGGANYTISGTSQLMSVPYALHSKTAESVTGTINYTETDPEYSSSEASNVTATDITNLSNLSGVNTGDQDISGIALNTQAIIDTAVQIRADFPDVSGFVSTETDPEYNSSHASNISAADIINLSNLSGINTGDQDISIVDDSLVISGGSKIGLEDFNYWGKENNSLYSNESNILLGNVDPLLNYQARTSVLQWDGSKSRALGVSYNSDAYTGSDLIIGTYSNVGGSNDNNHYGAYALANGSGVGSQNAIYGEAKGSGIGIQRGVFGGASGTGDGNQFGVIGESSGSGAGNQYGVVGNIFGSGSGYQIGIYGQANPNTTAPNYGIYGFNGNATAGAGFNTAIYGEALGNENQNYAIDGTAKSTVGDNYGVSGWSYGETSGINYGLYGYATGATAANYGVYGVVEAGTTSPIQYSGYFKGAPLAVEDDNIYIKDFNKGVILTSPNGTCYQITVDDSGALSTNSVTCPD